MSIVHRYGRHNANADTLSRLHLPSQDSDGDDGLDKVMAALTVEPSSVLKRLQ